MCEIEEPSADQVNHMLTIWEEQAELNPWSVYQLQAEIVEDYFKKHPENKNKRDVLTKSHLLNSLYHTRISNEHLNIMANNIVNVVEDCDQRLAEPDLVLVNKIADIDKYYFSFATKYCSFHHREYYPIYDKFVDRALWYFRCEFNFDNFNRCNLKNYPVFYASMTNFINHYNLEEFTWTEIDKYLWLVGKDTCII